MMSNPVVVDLSHWQEDPIDFAEMREGGTRGVILKCTEGTTYDDPTYVERAEAAHAAGLLVASYHFLKHGDIPAQMKWYVERAAPAPGERLVIDFEDQGCTLNDLLAAVEYLLNNTECQIAVYGASFLFDTVRDNYAPELAATQLWAARYSQNEPEITCWPRWDLWQYTDQAECSGLAAVVDGNKWNPEAGDLADWFYDPAFRKPVTNSVTVAIDVPQGIGIDIYINGQWLTGREPGATS